MVPVRDKTIIQIEVTNKCDHECTNCSRFVGHYKKTYFMDLNLVEKAIDSLLDFPGGIGIMGGEPLMHPRFTEICELMRLKVPPDRRYLWTSGYNWNQYSSVVKKTFGDHVFFNNHEDVTQKHHPMLMSISDVIDDPELVGELVKECWVNQKWSASVNPKGVFFCEIAAAMDMLFDGPGGHPVEKGWWQKNPEDFLDQQERYCRQCGACVPFGPVTLQEKKDVVSLSNFNKLVSANSPKLQKNCLQVIDQKISREQLAVFALNWKPWEHLGVKEDQEQGKSKYNLYGKLYGYKLKLKNRIRTSWWVFRSGEVIINRLIWRFKILLFAPFTALRMTPSWSWKKKIKSSESVVEKLSSESIVECETLIYGGK